MSSVNSNSFNIFSLVCMPLIFYSCLIVLTRYFSVPWGFFFFFKSFSWKAGVFVTQLCCGLLQLPLHPEPNSGKTERKEKALGFWLYPFRTMAPLFGGKVSSPFLALRGSH